MESNKKSVQEELEKISPKVSKVFKKEATSFPEGYFDQMQQSVLNQIAVTARESEEVKPSLSLIPNIIEKMFITRASMAFTAILLLGFGMAYYLSLEPQTSDHLANVSDIEIRNYLLYEASDEDLLAFIDDPIEINMTKEKEFIDEDILIDHLLDEMDEEDIEELF